MSIVSAPAHIRSGIFRRTLLRTKNSARPYTSPSINPTDNTIQDDMSVNTGLGFLCTIPYMSRTSDTLNTTMYCRLVLAQHSPTPLTARGKYNINSEACRLKYAVALICVPPLAFDEPEPDPLASSSRPGARFS